MTFVYGLLVTGVPLVVTLVLLFVLLKQNAELVNKLMSRDFGHYTEVKLAERPPEAETPYNPPKTIDELTRLVDNTPSEASIEAQNALIGLVGR